MGVWTKKIVWRRFGGPPGLSTRGRVIMSRLWSFLRVLHTNLAGERPEVHAEFLNARADSN